MVLEPLRFGKFDLRETQHCCPLPGDGPSLCVFCLKFTLLSWIFPSYAWVSSTKVKVDGITKQPSLCFKEIILTVIQSQLRLVGHLYLSGTGNGHTPVNAPAWVGTGLWTVGLSF